MLWLNMARICVDILTHAFHRFNFTYGFQAISGTCFYHYNWIIFARNVANILNFEEMMVPRRHFVYFSRYQRISQNFMIFKFQMFPSQKIYAI